MDALRSVGMTGPADPLRQAGEALLAREPSAERFACEEPHRAAVERPRLSLQMLNKEHLQLPSLSLLDVGREGRVSVRREPAPLLNQPRAAGSAADAMPDVPPEPVDAYPAEVIREGAPAGRRGRVLAGCRGHTEARAERRLQESRR